MSDKALLDFQRIKRFVSCALNLNILINSSEIVTLKNGQSASIEVETGLKELQIVSKYWESDSLRFYAEKGANLQIIIEFQFSPYMKKHLAIAIGFGLTGWLILKIFLLSFPHAPMSQLLIVATIMLMFAFYPLGFYLFFTRNKADNKCFKVIVLASNDSEDVFTETHYLNANYRNQSPRKQALEVTLIALAPFLMALYIASTPYIFNFGKGLCSIIFSFFP